VSTGQIMVQTAVGEQPLAEGIIYTHEHLWLNLATEKDPQGKLDQLHAIIDEIHQLKELGVGAIMELTCLGMGRNVNQLRRIQLATGIQIIPATGYYHHGFHPQALAYSDIDQIATALASELSEGIDGTSIRPMILGEIGGSGSPLHQDEVKVFRAVARLAQEFPVVVTTHAHLGTGSREELQLLTQGGLAPQRILIGHLDLCPSLEDVLFIARQGAYVGIDTVGKTSYASDERRVTYVKALVDEGLADHILLSCDISRNRYLRQQGGHGYAHLIHVFLPMLIATGLSPAIVQRITVENPRRFLAAAHAIAN
jgi:predicted metal-dependent phosphotriesterase family hydrolase